MIAAGGRSLAPSSRAEAATAAATAAADSLCHSHTRSVKRVWSEVSLAALCASLEDAAERDAEGGTAAPSDVFAELNPDLRPGVFTSTEPAWNNMNLVRLSEKLRSEN